MLRIFGRKPPASLRQTAGPVPAIDKDVITGVNGTLFIHQGAHCLYDQASGKQPVRPEALAAFQDNLTRRRALCDALGIAHVHLLAPDKQTICHSDYPLEDVYSVGRAIADAGGDYLFPADVLSPEDYFQTDSHWNAYGHLKVISAVLSRLDLPDAVAERDLVSRIKTRPFTGDLGVKLDPRQGERAPFLPVNPVTQRKSNGLEKTGNEGILEVLTNRRPALRKTLLCFGDSFTRIMLPALSRVFEVVVFCRTRYLHGEMLHMVRPDICMTQNLERYFNTTEPDHKAVPFLMLPALKGRAPAYTPDALDLITTILSPGTPRHAALLASLRRDTP